MASHAVARRVVDCFVSYGEREMCVGVFFVVSYLMFDGDMTF